MFVRFREMKAERYGPGERICAGKCKDRPRVYARHGIGMYVQGRTFLKGCPLKPLCPLAQPRTRLEVSIIETHREGGKVKQEHIASLGSVVGDGVEARVWFWQACDERLASLANRIGPDMHRLRQAIAMRIPEPTREEVDALEMRRWQDLQAGWQGIGDDDRNSIAKDEEAIAETRERIAKLQPVLDSLGAMVKKVQTQLACGNHAFVEAVAQERHAADLILGQMLTLRVGFQGGKRDYSREP